MTTTVPATSPTPLGHPLRSVLRGRDFRRLYGTRLASQCADGVFQVSLAGAVLFNPERAAAPAAIAAGFAALLLPYSVVGPFAGVLLDRWRRQRVLVLTNLFRCLAVALVAIEIATGTSGALFYGTALVVVSVNRFFLAALSASLPHVVTQEALVTANALATTSGTVVALLGGGIALGLRELIGAGDAGYALIAVASAAGYAASAWAATGFGKDLLGPDDVERSHRETLGDVARGLVAGARHISELRPVAYALSAIAAHRFFYGLSTISVLLLYRNYFVDAGFFQAELAGLGQVFAASGLGVLVAAMITPTMVRRIGKPAWIALVFAVAAATELALGLPFTMPTLLPAAFVLSIAAQGSKISVDTLVQEGVEDEYRGRVFSLYDTLFNVMFVAAAVVGALVLPDSGRSYAVVAVIAAGYAVTALSYRLATRRV